MKMDKKMKTILAIVLLASGVVCLSFGGILAFNLLAAGTSPTLIYSFPDNGTTIEASNNQFCFYVWSGYPASVPLSMTYAGHACQKATYSIGIPNGISLPEDVDNNGVVDITDENLVTTAFNSKIYNASYDFNHDGKVDLKDIGIVAKKVNTQIFLYQDTLAAGYYNNIIVMVNDAGSTTSMLSFQVGQPSVLQGTWFLDNNSTATDIVTTSFTLMFQSTGSISTNTTAFIEVDTDTNTKYPITKISDSVWQTTFVLGSGLPYCQTITAEITDGTTANTKTYNVMVQAPSSPLSPVVVVLFVSGIGLFGAGVFVFLKRNS